ALATSSLAYGSRISGSGRSVSTARAAATITAVLPTLVLMSQVSSCVRSELNCVLPLSVFVVRSVGRLAETRPQQRAADGLVGQLLGHLTAQPGHLVAVVGAVHSPAVIRQPFRGVRSVRLVVGERLDVHIQAESVPHPAPARGVAVR